MAITTTITKDLLDEILDDKGKAFAVPFEGTLTSSGVLVALQNDDDSVNLILDRLVFTDAAAENFYLCTGTSSTVASGVAVSPTNRSTSGNVSTTFATAYKVEGTVGLAGLDSTQSVALQARTQAGVLNDFEFKPALHLRPGYEAVLRVGTGGSYVIGTFYFERDEEDTSS